MAQVKYLFLTLVFSLSLIGCSSDNGSSAAVPPVDDDIVTVLSWPYSTGNSSLKPVGAFFVTNGAVYDRFFRTAFDFAVYGQNSSFTDYDYDYNYTCDVNIWDWIFGGSAINCQTEEQRFNDYLNWLANEGTVVEILSINEDGLVDLRIHLGTFIDSYRRVYYDEHVRSFDIQGLATRDFSGRLIIDAGSLVFASLTTDSTDFDIYFENSLLGQIVIR